MMSFGRFILGGAGFVPDPDALYATFTLRNTESLSGWRSGNQRCEPAQVLSDGGQNKLILGGSWTTQSKSAEFQDALKVRKPHLDLLALTSRCLEALGASERPGNVPGVLMYVARDLARWFFWTALRFERAYIAVELACTIQNRLALVHGAARSEPLSSRAVVDVAGRIISKVAAREGAIVPLRLVEHRDMWRDALLLDQPVQHRSGSVSGIADKPLRLEAKALLCSLDHGLRRADLGLANGAGGLDIDDDAELHINQIIVGVSEECRPLVSAGPLGRGIGRRDELRDDVAGRTPRRFVEGRQILLHGAAGPRRIAILVPILTCDRTLLIGVGLDQARIDGKAFAANQTGRNTCLDDPFEHATETVSIAEALVAGARKCRMIRDSILDTELAEPAIGEVHLHFTADQPLRTDRKDIPYD